VGGWRGGGRVGMRSGWNTGLSALGLNKAPVVSNVPGRVDRPGTNSFALLAPLTWQVPQLIPARRATSPRIDGELKARSPSATTYDVRSPRYSELRISCGTSTASSLSSVPAGSTA